MNVLPIVEGIGAGVIFGLSSFFKTNGSEKLDWIKLTSTLLISTAAGVYMSFANIDIGIAYNTLIAMGGSLIIENAVKAVYRKFFQNKMPSGHLLNRALGK